MPPWISHTLQSPLMLYGGCLMLIVLFTIVVIVGMIALVMIISVSILDRYDLFCLNKGNVFIFSGDFF